MLQIIIWITLLSSAAVLLILLIVFPSILVLLIGNTFWVLFQLIRVPFQQIVFFGRSESGHHHLYTSLATMQDFLQAGCHYAGVLLDGPEIIEAWLRGTSRIDAPNLPTASEAPVQTTEDSGEGGNPSAWNSEVPVRKIKCSGINKDGSPCDKEKWSNVPWFCHWHAPSSHVHAGKTTKR